MSFFHSPNPENNPDSIADTDKNINSATITNIGIYLNPAFIEPSRITEISMDEIRAVRPSDMKAKVLKSDDFNPELIFDRFIEPEIEELAVAELEISILDSISVISMLILKLRANKIGAATNAANPMNIA